MKKQDIIKAFNLLKDDKNMQTSFYKDGCVQRTGLLLEAIPEACYMIAVSYPDPIKCKETGTEWMQHHIPFVKDNKGNVIVMDICLMDGPETLEEYQKHFDNLNIIAGPEAELSMIDDFNHNRAVEMLSEIAKTHTEKIAPNQVYSKWLEQQTLANRALKHNIQRNVR